MHTLHRAFLAFALGAALLLPSAALAQGPEDPGESRATSFQAVEGPQREEVSGGALLLGAYATVWTLVMGYVLYLGFLQSRTTREVELLERTLGDQEDSASETAKEKD